MHIDIMKTVFLGGTNKISQNRNNIDRRNVACFISSAKLRDKKYLLKEESETLDIIQESRWHMNECD